MDLQGIYLIRNKINDKKYIGSSINCTYRWAQHLQSLQLNKHHNEKLQIDFIKYGYSNFTFEILELISNKDKLLSREGYYIETHKSYKDEFGYNIVINSNPLTKQRIKKEKENNRLNNTDDDILNYYTTIDEEIKNKIRNNINIFKLKDMVKFKNDNHCECIKQNSFSKSWLIDENNSLLVRKMLINYFRRINLDKNMAWTTFIQLKNDLKDKGYTKKFITIDNYSANKYTNLAFVMNIYNNVLINSNFDNTKENNNKLALSVILKWIINNADIENGATIFIPSKRMSDLLINYLNKTGGEF